MRIKVWFVVAARIIAYRPKLYAAEYFDIQKIKYIIKYIIIIYCHVQIPRRRRRRDGEKTVKTCVLGEKRTLFGRIFFGRRRRKCVLLSSGEKCEKLHVVIRL